MKIVVTAVTLATLGYAGGHLPSHSAATPAADVVYVADLRALNTAATKTSAVGNIRFTVHGDSLTIHVRMHDVPAGIEHWQHFHGFPDGHQSTCPTLKADTSHDGLIDILETEPAAGTTMVPFNADPVAMDIPTHTYPQANKTGVYDYTKTVSLAALQKAFGAKYTGGTIDLSRRVAMVHGVPESTALPKTVSSLGPIPARVTLPIACGAIRKLP